MDCAILKNFSTTSSGVVQHHPRICLQYIWIYNNKANKYTYPATPLCSRCSIFVHKRKSRRNWKCHKHADPPVRAAAFPRVLTVRPRGQRWSKSLLARNTCAATCSLLKLRQELATRSAKMYGCMYEYETHYHFSVIISSACCRFVLFGTKMWARCWSL